MSALINGIIVDTNLSKNARGGTEQMRDRLLKYVDSALLKKVVIHFSRIRSENYSPIYPNIYYSHDLPNDPESNVLANGGWIRFKKIVFVSHWQQTQFIAAFNIPIERCTVIENAIELKYESIEKSNNKINFIYHTTPHRGLELLYPIFDALSKEFTNIHLDVYSSFEVYGWKERDKQYEQLFALLRNHSHITYHGAKSNNEVLKALKKSHIFLYPSIWQETSCIAMIEALKSGCMVIHPNLAALPETASEKTVMYDYTENRQDHANLAYSIIYKILQNQKSNPNFINNYVIRSNPELPVNSIESFTNKWNLLLEKIV